MDASSPPSSSVAAAGAGAVAVAAEKSCHVCGKEAMNKCSHCKNTRYCSRDCQKADWNKHKTVCAPAKITVFDAATSKSIEFEPPNRDQEQRRKMYAFKQQYLENAKRQPGFKPRPPNTPFLSFDRLYWGETCGKQGCDDEAPDGATVSLRAARDSVDDCVGFWPIAPHPNREKYPEPYVYNPKNYVHEDSVLNKEEFLTWCLQAEEEESLCRMPPKGYTPLRRPQHTVTINSKK